MGKAPISKDVQIRLRDAAEEGQKDIEKAMDKVRKDPNPPGRKRTILRILAEKLDLLATVVGRSTTLDVSEDDIEQWSEELDKNLDDVGAFLEVALDAVINLLESVFDLITGLGKKIISVFEETEGEGEVSIGANGKVSLKGTARTTIRPGYLLEDQGLPAVLAETEGQFAMALEPMTPFVPEEAEMEVYRVSKYGLEGAANLDGIADLGAVFEFLDERKLSVIEIAPDNSFQGKVYTAFTSPMLNSDEFGPVHGRMKVKGQLNADRTHFKFQALSSETVSLTRFK